MKKLKKSFLFFCVIIFYLNTVNNYSQQDLDSINIYYALSKNVDSIDLQLKYLGKTIAIAKKHSINKMLLKGYNRKSFLFGITKEYDSAIYYAKMLLELSIITKNKKKQALAYKKLADNNRATDSLLLSLEFYKKYNKISITNKDTLAQIKALRYIAFFQKKFGSSFESETTATKALKLADQLELNDELMKIKLGLYNHLGIIYKKRGNYSEALKLYDRALKASSKITKQKHINTLLNNIANTYLEQKNYKSAIQIFREIYKNKSDTITMTRALNNLGIAQAKMKNPEGLKNINKALKIRIEKNDISGMYNSYLHLAEYYKDSNNIKSIRIYADKAYKLAERLHNNKLKIEALSFLMNVNNDKKVVEYKKLKDSILKVEQSNSNKYANQKYDLTKKEKNIINQRFYKLLYLAIGTFLLITLVFSIITLKRKNKKDKLQQVYKTETRISQKIHDEVANDVFGIMTKLQTNESENMEILDDLERVYFKTRDISKENSIINFNEDFGTILQDLLISYGDNQVNVITRNLNEIDWKSISKLRKTVIYRVLQELMTNMKKHSKASVTVISFSNANKKINIAYKDNGIGCIVKKNVGLQIVETRIKSVKGSVTFESQTNKGFEVKISI